MPEDELFRSEESMDRADIADALRDAATQIADGEVHLESDSGERTVTVPEQPLFEVELERLTDSETGEQRYELEYEIRWEE